MTKKTVPFRLAFLALTLLMSVLAMLPPKAAEAADCGAPWSYYGCCYAAGRVTMKQEQTCCDNGSCYHNYRCTSSLCPV